MCPNNPKLILLLGPSGIGKTTITKAVLKRVSGIKLAVLDNIVHQRARDTGLIEKKQDLTALIKILDNDRDRFFEYGLSVLEEYMGEINQPLLLDVGTGFLDAERSINWVVNIPSICVIAQTPDAFSRFKKARKLDISYEQYMTTQFSLPRRKIYESADIVLKTDKLTVDESVQRFFSALSSLFSETTYRKIQLEWLEA